MVNQVNSQDKKVLAVAQELSGLLTNHRYDEAWEKVGELNSLLKKRDDLSLPPYMIDMLQQHIKSYHALNGSIIKTRKAMTAIGYKLADFK